MQFTGTKTLDAEVMTRGEYNLFRGWVIPENENPDDEGYKVVYEDGYVSWSPKATFEAAYRPSGTPLERMRIEQDELIKKILALTAFTKGKIFPTLEQRMQVLMANQISAMSDYSWALSQRFKMMEQ